MSSVSEPETVSAAAYRRGALLVVSGGVCLSLMGIGIRLIETANAWQILFYRSLGMVPFLFVIIALRSGGRPWGRIRRAGLAGLAGGAGLVVAFAGGIYAIQETTVANAVFLLASAPLLAALLGLAVLGERVRRATWVAMAVAAAGVAVMVAEGVRLGAAAGNAAALAAACGFAVFAVALRWRRLEDMLPAALVGAALATAVAAAACLGFGHSLVVPARDAAIGLGLGVVQLGLGLALFTAGAKALPAAELALLSMIEVVLGPIWVWLLLGETVSAATLLGGAVLMGALAFNALSGIRRRPPPPPL